REFYVIPRHSYESRNPIPIKVKNETKSQVMRGSHTPEKFMNGNPFKLEVELRFLLQKKGSSK
ncbi:MAG: hypothetical protein JW841_00415, partial [Deltaproteobacteria bacterium]|nr:hypothetical protein [Deltaproteobacteria bacterium]